MAGLLKKHFPACEIFFLGRTYTQEVIGLSKHVDGFINYDELEKLPAEQAGARLKALKLDVFLHVFPKKEIALLAKKADVPLRVGTRNRWYHWLYCNTRISLSRKNSELHEAQLNFKLLDFLGIATSVPLADVQQYYGFEKLPALNEEALTWIDKTKFNLILHPKSKGSAKEWGLKNFEALVELLPKEKYRVFISGTAQDAEQMQGLTNHPAVINIAGKLSLQQFIAFINNCDGLIAASTGPLHIAAALNKKALGLFSPMRPIHPGRWAPLGKRAGYLVFDPFCENCKKHKDCLCIQNIKPLAVLEKLNDL